MNSGHGTTFLKFRLPHQVIKKMFVPAGICFKRLSLTGLVLCCAILFIVYRSFSTNLEPMKICRNMDAVEKFSRTSETNNFYSIQLIALHTEHNPVLPVFVPTGHM